MRSPFDPERPPINDTELADYNAGIEHAKAHYYRADKPGTRHTCECGVRTRLPVCDRCRQRKARAEKEERS